MKTTISGCCEITEAEHGAIACRLAHPQRRLPLDELANQWFYSVAVVRCGGGRSLVNDPRGIGKLRGAWGEQLKAAASQAAIAGKPCSWTPPCAFDVFFRAQGRVTAGLEMPKPYVLALIPDGADLLVRLTVFGFATDWMEAAVEALVCACKNVLVRGKPLAVTDRIFWSEESLAVPVGSEALVLAFETPLEIRNRKDGETDIRGSVWESGFSFPKFVATLGNRVSGLARWQDTEVENEFRALLALGAASRVQLQQHLPERWRRFSQRQGRWIPMGGQRLVVLIEGRLGPLAALLTIGETCHAGSHVNLGLGRYSLFVPR